MRREFFNGMSHGILHGVEAVIDLGLWQGCDDWIMGFWENSLANHNREETARILGISERNLYRKLREYDPK